MKKLIHIDLSMKLKVLLLYYTHTSKSIKGKLRRMWSLLVVLTCLKGLLSSSIIVLLVCRLPPIVETR